MRRRFVSPLPSPPTGYILNPERGFFSIVVAEATTNLVANSSGEVNATGYTGLGGGVVARTSDQHRWGAYSIRYTPTANTTDGLYYLITLTAGQIYTFSLDAWLPPVLCRYYIYDNTATGIVRAEKQIIGKGAWEKERLFVTADIVNTGEHWLVVRKVNSPSISLFYLDGVQLENKAYPTTYCDGDQQGLIKGQTAYFWNGMRHASTSSRIAHTNAGGRVVRLDDLGFKVSGMFGTGHHPVTNVMTPNALLGGSTYQRTLPQSRQFNLTGVLSGHSLQELMRRREAVTDALRQNHTAIQQPVLLRYQLADCGDTVGSEVEIPCLYDGGLEGAIDNEFMETVPARFLAPQPYWRGTTDQALTTSDLMQLVDNDFIMQRSALGDWANMNGTGLSGACYTLAVGPDGRIYAGGNFTQAINIPALGGVINVNYVAVWNGQAWDDLDGGVNGIVRGLAFDGEGNLYAVGEFTTAGAVPVTVNRVAKWNGTAWSALGATPGVDATARAVVYGGDGYLYVGGDFANAGGGAAARIARWNGTAWSALGAGLNNVVRALAFDNQALASTGAWRLYVGGDFTTAGGSSANRVARWDGTNWGALSTGMNAAVYALTLSRDGKLYAGGGFTTAGDGTISGIAVWDGTVWAELGTGTTAGANVYAIAIDPATGIIWVGGTFPTAGSVSLIDGFAGWNGSAWFQPDVWFRLVGGPVEVYTILSLQNGTLTVGFSNNSDNATSPLLITATNNGDAEAYPRVIMSGAGSIHQVVNYTTGDAIWFDDLTLVAGEVVTLDLTPGQKGLTSSLRGNILSRILPGSNLSTWRLLPGANTISIHIPHVQAAASLIWRDAYLGIDAAVTA